MKTLSRNFENVVSEVKIVLDVMHVLICLQKLSWTKLIEIDKTCQFKKTRNVFSGIPYIQKSLYPV